MFVAEVTRRFERVQRRIRALVIDENAFDLSTNVFCPTGEGGGVDPTCSPGGARARLPAIGSNVKIGSDTHYAEHFFSDDTFPPAIASYEIKDGYIIYTGRNGSEGVVTGTEAEAEKWMADVRKEVQSNPPAGNQGRGWEPSDGGLENVQAAKAIVHETATKFGIETPSVRLVVVDRPMEGGEHTYSTVSLNNPHLKSENKSLNFKTSVSTEVHIASHETVHSAYASNPERGAHFAGILKSSGETVSIYHSFAGHFEGLMDLGAAYVHSPQELKKYSPKLFDIADGWANSLKNPTANRFQFATSAEKLEKFQDWLANEMQAEILTDPGMTSDDWWEKYVLDGYTKGAGRAFDDAKKPYAKGYAADSSTADIYAGSKEEFLRASFAQPVAKEKVKLLASRIYTDLKGVTEVMSTHMTRALADGLVQGKSPREVARDLSKQVEQIGLRRATMIARTETIRAHAEGQLDALTTMGMTEVGVEVEWVTAYKNVCPICLSMKGKIFKIAKAHGMIPAHPNCRCAFAPALPNEEDLIKDPKEYLKTLKNKPPTEAELAKIDAEKAAKEAELKAAEEAAAEVAKGKAKDKSQATQADKEYADVSATAREATGKKGQQRTAELQAIVDEDAKAQAEAISAAVAEAKAKAEAEAVKKAKAVADAAAKARAEVADKVKADAIAREAAGELPDLVDLRRVKSLPGSTRPELMENIHTGKQWVMKSTTAGIAPEHLKSEALADKLYSILGIETAKSGIKETATGPVKLSEFLEGGQTLADAKSNGLKGAALKYVHERAHQGFVADALFANHDVVGLSFDNLFIIGSKPIRIDNGGALKYRAQGQPKNNFGPIVTELNSMRDPSVNSNTAEVFGTITQARIDAQIKAIVKKRKELLEAIPDEGLRATIDARIDYLAGLLKDRPKPMPKGKGEATDKQETKGRPVAESPTAITMEAAERVKRARSNGVTFRGDRGLIEDNNILVWGEKDSNGKDIVKVQFKATPEGGKAIDKAMGQTLASAEVIGGASQVYDPYWTNIESLAKHLTIHAADGIYNTAKLEELKFLTNYVDTALKTPGELSTVPPDLLKHYQQALANLNNAYDTKKAPGWIDKYAPLKPKTEDSESSRVRRQPLEFPTSEFDNGRNKRNTGKNQVYGTSHYVVDLGDGVTATYSPPSGLRTQAAGRALDGQVQITVAGEPSPDTIKLAMAKVNAMGIDTTPSDKWEEMVYLHRTAYMRDPESTHTKEIMAAKDKSDEEKVDLLKAHMQTKYGIDVDTLPKDVYNPAGRPMSSFGDGYRIWDRFDLPRSTVEKEMKDYVLVHNSNTPTPLLVDRLLGSGGWVTSTTERLRKGVSIAATGGMSPMEDSDSIDDVKTGGASYFFTRISKKGAQANNRGAFHFKPGLLARQDLNVQDDDTFGAISGFDNRASKVEDYKRFAEYNRNETNVKGGMSLLDDIQTIKAHSERDREEILEMFRKHKVTVLPDGRKIEEVVKYK